eukprot:2915928-Amphidinium_carterae.2
MQLMNCVSVLTSSSNIVQHAVTTHLVSPGIARSAVECHHGSSWYGTAFWRFRLACNSLAASL